MTKIERVYKVMEERAFGEQLTVSQIAQRAGLTMDDVNIVRKQCQDLIYDRNTKVVKLLKSKGVKKIYDKYVKNSYSQCRNVRQLIGTYYHQKGESPTREDVRELYKKYRPLLTRKFNIDSDSTLIRSIQIVCKQIKECE